jgi:hypothetical protein
MSNPNRAFERIMADGLSCQQQMMAVTGAPARSEAKAPARLQDCGLVPKRNTEFFDQAGTEAWAMSRA